MAIDLSQFHDVFFEESFEGLDVMESSLLELNPENVDDETINAIFRAAHSIKGGSATFGFTAVSEFTHVLETLLDQIRSGKRGVTGEDISLFLQSVDCMRDMLSLIKDGESGKTELADELNAKFFALLNQEKVSKTSKVDDTEATGTSSSTESCKPKINEWHIHFSPSLKVLQTGNDIVRIFHELNQLGEVSCTVNLESLPVLSLMDSENCYLSWDIVLIGACELHLVEEVFEWVADDSHLNIFLNLDQHAAAENVVESTNENTAANWHIHFQPKPNILASGNEPSRFIAALKEFGDVTVEADYTQLPEISSLNPEHCFLAWHIHLVSSSATHDAIKEVFEWVEDDAHIVIEQLGENASKNKAPLEISPVITDDTSTASVDSQPDMPAITSTSVSNDSVKANTNNVQSSDVPVKANQVTKEAKQTVAVKKSSVETSSIRVGIDKIDNLINMVGELVITQSMLGQLGVDFDLDRLPKLIEGLNQLEQNTRELQESVMKIRMLPISFAFSRFPRMVRDLEQALNKSVDLEMHGEQTELDKTVMEKIGDPLVHLVRNAVDHGIELPAEREAKGKSPRGRIILNAFHQGGNVVIEIIDDGKGLDRDKLIAKAIERNIITELEGDNLTDEQAFDLIFQPGFSTAKTVSDVSGRGVGMDVVKRNIQALNGIVELSSKPDQGSSITIRLPLTLAILDGQLVRVGDNTYIFPLVSIVESLQCKKDYISKVAGGCHVFRLREEYVPIIALYRAFDITPDSTDLHNSLLVVVENDGNKVGIVVDELLAQQQVVIKSLEQNYHRVTGVSGATILGDGTVALILDIPGIVKLSGTDMAYSLSYANQIARKKEGSGEGIVTH